MSVKVTYNALHGITYQDLSLRLSQSMSDISSRTMQRNFKRHSVSDTVRSRVSIVATDRARFVSSMTLSRESSIRQFMFSFEN